MTNETGNPSPEDMGLKNEENKEGEQSEVGKMSLEQALELEKTGEVELYELASEMSIKKGKLDLRSRRYMGIGSNEKIKLEISQVTPTGEKVVGEKTFDKKASPIEAMMWLTKTVKSLETND